MNRLTKLCVLTATLVSMAFTPLAQASAASGQFPASQRGIWQQMEPDNIHQIRNSRHRHHNYKKHHKHRTKRCTYSHRRGKMVCQPRYRHR